MLSRWALRLAVFLALAPPALAAEPDIQGQIIAQINLAREHPAQYAEQLQAYRAQYRGFYVDQPGSSVQLVTNEGVAAVDEAIAFLRVQPSLPPISADRALGRSARTLVQEQGSRGLLGHYGAFGSSLGDRIANFGVWQGLAAENISYGPRTAVDVVRELIIDDGEPDRGHRGNIFDERLRVAGAACGPHKLYGFMCVIDFASQIRDR